MKLISEYNDYQMTPVVIEENAKGQKEYFIEGVFMQSEIKNRNGRVYPKESNGKRSKPLQKRIR